MLRKPRLTLLGDFLVIRVGFGELLLIPLHIELNTFALIRVVGLTGGLHAFRLLLRLLVKVLAPIIVIIAIHIL